MSSLRLAVFGTGFWSRFQLAAWREVGGVDCVAVYNRTRSKGEAVARDFGIPHVYDDPAALLDAEPLDFVDIITDVESHPRLAAAALERGIATICQKPMAPSLDQAREMVRLARDRRVPLFIHENWRWQSPIRALKRAMDDADLGTPFRARIEMISGFPVFKNQPFLVELDQFILTDLGSHTLDVARFLFGEAESLYCQTCRVHEAIRGEDVATVVMRMGGATTVTVAMAYAGNFLERDRFPETFLFVECPRGSIELAPDYWLRVTNASGTFSRRVPPPRYAWADPAYDVVHSSIVACNANLLGAMRGEAAETTAEDNLKTCELYFGAYDSAREDRVIHP